MCGIAGAIGPDADALTRRITACLVHRGPDDDGFHSALGAALSFRRLSIIDLEGGAQPILNETGDIALVCNGEIYNSPELRRRLIDAGHRFRSCSDVEVILHLYEDHGEDCARHLRGMFAFAIWDTRNRSLLLGKDHMGQKPLFFYRDGERFLFASEIQALMASGAVHRRLDPNSLWHYLSLRSMPDECSLVAGVYKLPAAHTLLRSADGNIRTCRYWTPDFRAKRKLRENEAEEALDECLREAVASHLLSDVPVGTFLSGGIDSTTIGAMMARTLSGPVPAFSIGVDEASFDELDAAEQVAHAEGMVFHGERVKANVASMLPMMVHHLGEPADPYAVGVYLVSRLAARHVKVALSGDGGDESFAGYDRYVGQRLVDYYCMLPAALRRKVMPRLIAAVPETFRYKSLAQRLAWLQSMSEVRGGERYARALGVLRFTPEERAELFHPEVAQSLTDPDTLGKVLRYFDAPNVDSLTDRMLHTDLMLRVPDHNLVMGDRMSMACSLEVRSPFVDPRLVEFAASLPADMKLKGRKLKYLLRRVAGRYLPPEIIRRPKQGFGFPVGLWMRRDLKALVEERLSNSHLVAAGIFRPEPIARIMSEHMEGRVDHSYRLWLLLNLEIWHEIYIEGRSVEMVNDGIQQLVAR
ncbi:asparagine synthase (glutamine-hydrolyzing) [Thioalkalivibrio sp.]|uniref:asparagine synthase (glutamine-hydrolyzing) n=1 Tax=Thioalkalivibrio sp. TaxID=2093813 RepID=UPI003565B6AE